MVKGIQPMQLAKNSEMNLPGGPCTIVRDLVARGSGKSDSDRREDNRSRGLK